MSEQSRAREEAEKKMGRLIKQQDHLERARREEEAPLLEAAYAKKVLRPISDCFMTRMLPLFFY